LCLNKIKAIAEENGCAFFGTCELGKSASIGFESLTYAISFGMRYPKTLMREITGGPNSTYFHQYRTMNASLDRIALLIQSTLLNAGYEAVYIPASQSLPGSPFRARLSHKIAAVKSGLGFIGKNNLFIHEKFGPAVRLSTVITDMPLPKGPQAKQGDKICETCDACVRACPAGALYNVIPTDPFPDYESMDVEKCSYTMKEKFKGIGRGSVCGVCMAVCPYIKL